MQDNKIILEHLRRCLADYMRELIESGEQPCHVASAAIAAGATLRLEVSGPLLAAQELLDHAKVSALDATIALAVIFQ